jgi:hypothetical protein
VLNNDLLKNAKPNMKILHPLPRVNEIAYEVDDNPHAYYIQQAGNGLLPARPSSAMYWASHSTKYVTIKPSSYEQKRKTGSSH